MKNRYSEEQVETILHDAASGTAAGARRKYGTSDAADYNWTGTYDRIEASDVRNLRAQYAENTKLKKLLAGSRLNKDALNALLEKYGSAR